jgi:hypothetical protein
MGFRLSLHQYRWLKFDALTLWCRFVPYDLYDTTGTQQDAFWLTKLNKSTKISLKDLQSLLKINPFKYQRPSVVFDKRTESASQVLRHCGVMHHASSIQSDDRWTIDAGIIYQCDWSKTARVVHMIKQALSLIRVRPRLPSSRLLACHAELLLQNGSF